MTDVFYFSERDVSCADIAALARFRKYPRVDLQADQVVIHLTADADAHVYWASFDFANHAEPPEAAALARAGIRSAFCVSHYTSQRDRLVALLGAVLTTFGGFVGNDAADFEPRFQLATIEGFRYPSRP